MKNHSLAKLTTFEFKLFFRSFLSVFFLLVFPGMMLVLFGSIYGNEPQEIYHGLGMVDVSVPAYAGMIVSVTGLMNLPLTLCEYREKKILKRFQVTPVNPKTVVAAQLIINLIMTTLGMILLYVIGKLFYGIQMQGNLLFVIFGFTLSMFSIFGIGFIIASLASNMKSASAISYIVYFPMLFLTGTTMPMEILPKSLQTFSKVLPVTHVVKTMQGFWLNQDISQFYGSIIVLVIVAILSFSISLKCFRWE